MICCWMGLFSDDLYLTTKIKNAAAMNTKIATKAMMITIHGCLSGSWKYPFRWSFSTKYGLWLWRSCTRWVPGGWFDWLVTSVMKCGGYLRSIPTGPSWLGPEDENCIGTRGTGCGGGGGCGTDGAGGLFVGVGKLRIASLLFADPNSFFATQWYVPVSYSWHTGKEKKEERIERVSQRLPFKYPMRDEGQGREKVKIWFASKISAQNLGPVDMVCTCTYGLMV